MWYANENASKNEKKDMIEHCEELEGYDLIVYENPADMKSVRSIPHLQILARKTREVEKQTIYFWSFVKFEHFKWINYVFVLVSGN